MKDEKKNTNQVTVQVQIDQGIAKFVQDHVTYFKELYGVSNLKEYLELMLPEDFNATLDYMHLNIQEIRAKYDIERGE